MTMTQAPPESDISRQVEDLRRERSAAVQDPARLAELVRSQLLDSEPEVEFDRITRLATKMLDAPVALVSLVDSHRQFFKSCAGLPEPWASRRETPLSHSFCQFVTCGEALIIEDARKNPLTTGNLAITDLEVVAYAGFPIRGLDGQVLGSFCVIDNKAREWTDEELEVIEGLARAVVAEIRLRVALRESQERAREAEKATAKLHEMEAELRRLQEQRAS